MPFIEQYIEENSTTINNKKSHHNDRDAVSVLSSSSLPTTESIPSPVPTCSILHIADPERERATRLVRRKFKAAVSTIVAVNRLRYLGQDMLRQMEENSQYKSIVPRVTKSEMFF